MKILVTGAGGQLSTELQGLSTNYTDYELLLLTKQQMSITEEEEVSKIITDFKPGYVINCAAYTAVDKAESDKEKAFAINGTATGLLAKYSLINNCRFIHISTDYVFDGSASSPMKEDHPVKPLNVYGESKLLGEQLAVMENPESIIIRTSWVYSSYGSNFVKTMIRLMNEREHLNVVNDQYGSPTYAADLAEAIMQIITSGKWKPGIYHYSNKGIISWFDFATEISSIIKSNCKVNGISSDLYPTPAKRPNYSVLDTSKFTQTFGIEMKQWKESLRTCINKISTGK
ncbi:MAG: dTDP-4-dehydrorhamnose reductase [Candidatus Dadabacteria bacterium]